MPIKICLTEGCENITEGRTDFCASCNSRHRKAVKMRATNKLNMEAKINTLKSTGKKWYPIPKVSEKRKVLNEEYVILREQYLKDHPECEIKLQVCTRTSTQIHHKASGTNKATNLNNTKTWLASCDMCNQFLHDKLSAKEARERNLKI